MSLEPVEVTARWDPSAGFLPTSMVWHKKTYAFESTGRHWEDEQGLHVLCMAVGGRVYELVFRLQPAGWSMVKPTAAHLAA